MNELLAMPREWVAAAGEIGRFTGNIVRDVWGLRVFRFFGEALRQSGILIVVFDTRDLQHRVHLRALVRDRGRVLHTVSGRAVVRGGVYRVVQSA